MWLTFMTETIDTTIFEQPLNEVIRVCLRTEQIFQQINHQLNDHSTLGTHKLVLCIINLLQLLDRPDLKAKLARELTYHLANLMRFGNMPEIDSEKLNDLTKQLDELARSLIDSSGKIGYRLREVELLNNLRLQLATPGGGCSFDTPLYHYWLQQPLSKRQAIILDWLNDFNQIKTATELVLDLVRKNSKIEDKKAIRGFHQELLDPQSNLRMIRIGLHKDVPSFPEISIGRHFLSVRFFTPDIQKRPTQYSEDLSFWIAYCNL